MTNPNSAAQAANENPLSDEYVNAIIQRHGYDSPECVIARLHQWIGMHGGENGLTLLMYEAHKALSKLRAPVADERAAFKKCHSAIIKALSSITTAAGPGARKADDPELLYRSPVMDDVVRIRVALDECSAALASGPVAGEAVVDQRENNRHYGRGYYAGMRRLQREVAHIKDEYGRAVLKVVDRLIEAQERTADAAPQASPVAGEADAALSEWLDKTDFIQKRIASGELPVKYLGWHRADVMRDLIEQPRPSDDKLWDQTLTERDEYHDMADKLANAIADHLLVEIGEHSSSNCPWMRALEEIENAAPQARTGAGEAVAWVAADTLNSPHPKCISSLAYMSHIDQERGREYVPLTIIDRYAAPVAAQKAGDGDARDAAFEAVRKRLCGLPRYSFIIGASGGVRRVVDSVGNWIEFDAAHELFDPVEVDAAMQQQSQENK